MLKLTSNGVTFEYSIGEALNLNGIAVDDCIVDFSVCVYYAVQHRILHAPIAEAQKPSMNRVVIVTVFESTMKPEPQTVFGRCVVGTS